jgi:hypothetical protein
MRTEKAFSHEILILSGPVDSPPYFILYRLPRICIALGYGFVAAYEIAESFQRGEFSFHGYKHRFARSGLGDHPYPYLEDIQTAGALGGQDLRFELEQRLK